MSTSSAKSRGFDALVKKTVSICIPCFNERDNIAPLTDSLVALFEEELQQYDYFIQFIDNCSQDGTRDEIKKACASNPKVRAIFNSRNFKSNSALYGLLQSDGDCAVYLSADFQDPVDKIPLLLEKWEEGYLIVAAIKKTSKENSVVYRVRSLYYKLMKKYSDVDFIEHFCNFGVYDKLFLDTLRSLKNPNYSIRGNVAEFGYNICYVEYEQQERRSGKSKHSFLSLANLGITNFIDYTDILLRLSIGIGGVGSLVCLITAVVYLIRKLIDWSGFATGIAPVLIGVFLVGALNMFLLGIIGEYVLSVRRQVKETPLVIEQCRINFDNVN